MPFINADRIKETTTTTGTGAITLAGAVLGFRAFYPTLSVGDTFKYFIVSTSGTEWESGLGTLTASSTLARTTVQSSSNVNPLTAVNFSAGLKEVGIGPTAGGETPWNPVTNTLDISVNALNDVAITSPTVNQVLKYSGTEWTNQADAVNVGTVTSVSGAGTVSGLTLTGTVTSSGSLTLGGAISTLNQNTTGNAATVTTNANLTGHVTSVGNAAVLGSFTSAQLAGALSDETGTGAAVFATSPTLVTPLSNSLSAVPVASGAGNSLTIAAGSGVTSGAGANLILNPGEQATTGGRGTVLIDGLNVGKGKGSGTENTVVGNLALAAITTGDYNTTIGKLSLNVNTTGSENVAAGYGALGYNTTGSFNVAVGLTSLWYNITGSFNVAVGRNAYLYNNGSNNSAFGYSAGVFPNGNINTGSNNTFIGAQSGMEASVVNPSNAIVIGYLARGHGSNTTTIGNTSTTFTYLHGTIAAVPVTSGAGNSLTIKAGSGVTSGAGGNLILNPGEQAVTGGRGTVLIDGLNVGKGKGTNKNTVIGEGALNAVTTGDGNIACGYQSLYTNAGGIGNVACGYQALYAMLNGNDNVGIGTQSLRFNISGMENVACGYQSLLLSTASSNTSIGVYSGRTLTTGSNNTFLGFSAGYNASQLASASNSMALGSGAFTTASNQVVIGNTSVTQIILNGTATTNAIAAIPVTSGAGNSLTIAAGSGVTSGAGGSLILQAGLQATSGGDGKVIVKQVAGQTSNLQEWQNSAGTVLGAVSAAGNVGIGTASPTHKLEVIGGLKVQVLEGSAGYHGTNPLLTLYGTEPGYTGELRIWHDQGSIYFGASTSGSFSNNNGFSLHTSNVSFSVPINCTNINSSAHSALTFTQTGVPQDITFITQNSSERLRIKGATGNIGIGTASPLAQTHIVTAAATKGLIVQGAASQTANLQEWQNSAGTVLASVDAAGNIKTTALTVATLTAAATAGAGARAFVSDSNATTFAAIVAGGGANGVPVYSDGTNWRIG